MWNRDAAKAAAFEGRAGICAAAAEAAEASDLLTICVADYEAANEDLGKEDVVAALDVHVAAFGHIVSAARARGVSPALPTALLEVFGEAARRCHGDEEIAAAIDVFRGPPAG